MATRPTEAADGRPAEEAVDVSGWKEVEVSHHVQITHTEADGKTFVSNRPYNRHPEYYSDVDQVYLTPEDIKLEIVPFKVQSFERPVVIHQPTRGDRTIRTLHLGIRDDNKIEYIGAEWDTPEDRRGHFRYFFTDGKPVAMNTPMIQGPMPLGSTEMNSELARHYLELAHDPRFGSSLRDAVTVLLLPQGPKRR